MSSAILRTAFRLNRSAFFGKSIRASTQNLAEIKHTTLLSAPRLQHICGIQKPSFATSSSPAALEENTFRPQTGNDYFQRVKSDLSQLGFVHFENLSKLVSQPTPLTDEQSLFVFECCAKYLATQKKESKIALFNQIWRRLKDERRLGKVHYAAAMPVFRNNQMPLGNFRLFLDESRLHDSPKVYEDLIYWACDVGDIKQAKDILADMRQRNFAITENVFNALILGHSRNKDISQAEAVLDTMNAANMVPSSMTYFELTRAYIENDQATKAIELLKAHPFSTKQLLSIVKSAAVRNLPGIVEIAVKKLPLEMLNVIELPLPVKLICTELLYNKQIEEAMFIVDAFPKPAFNENQDKDTYGYFLVQGLIRSGASAEQVISICKRLIESEKNERALHIATEITLRRNPADGLEYLEALSEVDKLRVHYFWPLFIHNFEENGEIGVLSTLKDMTRLGVEADYETISFYVVPRLSITLEDEKEALRALERCGVKPSHMMTPLICHLIGQQKLNGAVNLCSLYPTKLDTSYFVPTLVNLAISLRPGRRYSKYASLIKALAEKSENPKFDLAGQVLLEITSNARFSQDPETVRRIINECQRKDIQISSSAADVVENFLSKFEESGNDKRSASLDRLVRKSLTLPASDSQSMPHPRDMTLDQLECHLVELQSKGMNARGVLRRLLQLCVRDGRLERAVQVKAQCDRLKVQVSPGMMASVFEMYIKLKDVNKAEETLLEIKQTFPGFQIDEHKMIDYAALMVEKDMIDEAKQLLSRRAETTKITGNEYVTKNLWNLLTKVAVNSAKYSSPEDPNQAKDFFKFLQSLHFCRAPNTLIGPIVREWLLRKDLKNAIVEFNHACERYRRTPLQMEIVTLLVRLSNDKGNDEYKITPDEAKKYLQEVTAAVANIHGGVNMNSTLLLAVAECGTENQLRKLLINPEFRINKDAMVKNCEHMSTSGRIDALYRLGQACRGLGHVLKEEEIYNMLMTTFTKENNYAAALELFRRLEEDDDWKISQDFVKGLVNLLQANNIEIPANVALRAQLKS